MGPRRVPQLEATQATARAGGMIARGVIGAAGLATTIAFALAVGAPATALADAGAADQVALSDAKQRRVLASERGVKLRVAAVIALSRNLTDENTAALAHALITDQEAVVRRVAVIAVAKACGSLALGARTQTAACDAMTIARRDADKKVKKLALAAARAPAAPPTAPLSAGLYVYIPVTTRSSEHAQLVSAIGAGLAESSSMFSVDWASKTPQQADAARKSRRAYRVDVAAARIDVRKGTRGSVSLQCSVSMAVAPWYGATAGERWTASDTARITGSAKIDSTGTRAEATAECVRALGRDIAKKRLAAFLRTTSRQAASDNDVAKR